MSKIAALPMYNQPHLRAHNDELWRCIREKFQTIGFATEAMLDRGINTSTLWNSPNLGFAQTCGLPYVSSLRGKVSLLGTPDYGIISGQPGWYHSLIIARQSDSRATLAIFDGATFAYNDANSQSGLYALMYELQAQIGSESFFGKCLKSGSHVNSALAVIESRADIAAIDAVTWRYIQTAVPDVALLKVIGATAPNPGLPYITALQEHTEVLSNAVTKAIKTLPQASKQALGLKGFWHARPEDYDIIATRAKCSAAVITAHGIS